jgi:hypothetical protein
MRVSLSLLRVVPPEEYSAVVGA